MKNQKNEIEGEALVSFLYLNDWMFPYSLVSDGEVLQEIAEKEELTKSKKINIRDTNKGE